MIQKRKIPPGKGWDFSLLKWCWRDLLLRSQFSPSRLVDQSNGCLAACVFSLSKNQASLFFPVQNRPYCFDQSVVLEGIEPPTQGFSVLCSTN
jgi:hypothetical protein